MNLEKTNQYLNGKFFTIIGLLALFSVALFVVYAVTIEREGRLNRVTQEIEQKYAAQQVIRGPVLTQFDNTKILPQQLDIKVTSTSDTKSRGIFQVPIYEAQVEMSGFFQNFNPDEIESLDLEATNIKNISNISNTTNPRRFSPSPDETSLSQTANKSNQRNFNITFDIIGTKSLKFLTNGEENTLTIDSDWTTPSFQGAFLPIESELNQNGFTASWEHTSNQSFQSEYEVKQDAIGFEMFQPNNIYAKTTKSIKYGIVVIALVFFSFMIVEIFSKQKVNNLQYILIGLSLVIYYSLLLSLGEIVGFTIAYAIASLATILLNAFFANLLLKKVRYGFSIAAILSVVYLSIFALLQTTEYTLLLGSILAYIIVMVSMIASYFIDFENLKNNLTQSNV